MSSTHITSHPLSNPSTVHEALAFLRPHLPTCLPLYRRLQQGRFFASTVLLSNLSSFESPSDWEDKSWILAFVDRSSRPETEVWMYGSWESKYMPTPFASVTASDEVIFERKDLLRSLLAKIKELPLQKGFHHSESDGDGEDDQDQKDFSGTSRGEYAAHMADEKIMLFGAIHSSTAEFLERMGVVKNVYGKGAALVPNHTYVFTRARLPKLRLELPEGLRWGELGREHFGLVRSRTVIPRQAKTLAVLRNLAIFDESTGIPIAWAFIQLDGSLSTLHVEADWRGRALAKMTAIKLFEEKMPELWEDGVEEWAHGYVIEGNMASCGVCEAVGGKRGWYAYWVRVDLGSV